MVSRARFAEQVVLTNKEMKITNPPPPPKRHLGLKPELAPHARGFDKSFVYLAGAGNHYNNEPQLDSWTGFKQPAVWSDHLWMRDHVVLDRKKELPPDFYSTKSFTDELLAYLRDRSATDQEKPFFAYLAYTAPHWPLQAPRAVIDKYAGRYAAGPEALRAQRLASLVDRGLVPADVEPAPMVGDAGTKEWGAMTPDEQAHSARRMETYAAMVDLLDEHLGRVLAQLAATDELDKTLVLFMSDNGAEGKLLEALPVTKGVPLVKVIETYYNNSWDNIGNADSFTWYGPRWACAATAPSKGYKTMVTEGGIRCPCIVRYPPLALSQGKTVHDFTTVMDILPTLLELAGVPHPGTSFRGREVVRPRGRSWVQYLDGKEATVHGENGEQAVHGWELFGRRAIRRGNWKAVFEPAPLGSEEWELYDLSKDLGEVHDLAKKEPQILQELLVEWEKYFAETGMYDPGAEASRSKW